MAQLPIGVVFIHGNHKTIETWNLSEFGKKIDIEVSIRKRTETVMIQVDDFLLGPEDTVKSLLPSMMNRRWVIVCHSLGIVYCYELLKHLTITGICFIDCTDLEAFGKELADKPPCPLQDYLKEVKWNLSTKIVCHVHLNFPSEDFEQRVDYFSGWTRKNEKSKMIIHPRKGHMIHYTDSQTIIFSIMELLSYK